MASSVPAHELRDALSWWDEVNNSTTWQDRIFLSLAVLFGLVSLMKANKTCEECLWLIQFIKIECRVPEFGWTTQKFFHFLNFLVNGVSSLVFAFRRSVQQIKPEIIQHILLDFPGLVFFTTYALLVLFWAEIYYQACSVSINGLRPCFYAINTIIYAFQVVLWLLLWWKPIQATFILSKIFSAGVSLFAALGFLLYGRRLYKMLQRFPIKSKGREKKLQEMCFNAFDKDANLDVLNRPILNFLFYMFTEILPSSLVFFILRKLPPERKITQYHPIQ